ncbi:methyltransferase [Candidatus Aerophobetes bacterium]|nr:methyltransferase [Candidatus Aerophobetes bacterium]
MHPKHRLMNYHKFFIDNINEKDKILDVGCGNGFLTYELAAKAKK